MKTSKKLQEDVIRIFNISKNELSSELKIQIAVHFYEKEKTVFW